MTTFTGTQAQLNKLIAMPGNLPVTYLLGDTGAGKTCVVRQLLGTTDQRFPSARRLRTTVAPTEFIITNEPQLKAAFVFKTEEEISRNVTEILQKGIITAVGASADSEEPANLADLLGDSSDERFRLRCFLTEQSRENLAERIVHDIAPQIRKWVDQWAESEFPATAAEDRPTAIELAVAEQFRPDVDKLRDEILLQISDRVKSACQSQAPGLVPETFYFATTSRTEFIERLKGFLCVEEGAISPVIERARIRGSLRSSLIPDGAEIVVIDGEGIGHDAREARILSARHFDYFGVSDAIILVENSERAFTGGGKSVLASIAKHGYLPKFYLAFTRLDLVESEQPDREHQKREVDRGLRNALNALKDEEILLDRRNLRVRYFANMDKPQPDEATRVEFRGLIETILKRHGEPKSRFVAPVFDYELLAGFLVNATVSLRKAWQAHTQSGVWQTHRAFAYRMSWKQDEFRWLKPVAEFTDCLVTSLRPFVTNPLRWSDEITEAHRKDCAERLMQEISQQVLQFVRNELLEHEHGNWIDAAELRGTGTTRTMRRMILDIIFSAAPELTGEHAKEFKDAVKGIIERSIVACEG
jgi:hypothetical protein